MRALLSWISIFASVLIAAGCSEPTGCGGGTCPFGPSAYAVVTGTVTWSDGRPQIVRNKDVIISCAGGQFGHGESTDPWGRFRFELEPLSLPPEQTVVPCELRPGPSARFAPVTVDVAFAPEWKSRPTTVVHLRDPLQAL